MIPRSIWEDIRSKRRFVIKIGTSSLLTSDGNFDYVTIASLISGIKFLLRKGKEVLLVSSGAVSAGMKMLGIKHRPNNIVLQQVLAAVGNPLLLQKYMTFFEEIPIAQVLITQYDLSNRTSYKHLRAALEEMLKNGIVPVINENDVVSIDELVGTYGNPSNTDYNFSDNDVLSALTVGALEADVLIILSDVDGLYTKHPEAPGAQFIELVKSIDEEIRKMGKLGGKSGRGGMRTKILAAEIATKSGAYTIITRAKNNSIESILDGKVKCTVFLPSEKLSDRKLWLMYAANVEGKVIIDEGAKRALYSGASLLLPGVIDVVGDFVEKSVVDITDKEGNIIARAPVNYSAKVLRERLEFRKKGILPRVTFEIVTREKMIFLDNNECPRRYM